MPALLVLQFYIRVLSYNNYLIVLYLLSFNFYLDTSNNEQYSEIQMIHCHENIEKSFLIVTNIANIFVKQFSYNLVSSRTNCFLYVFISTLAPIISRFKIYSIILMVNK